MSEGVNQKYMKPIEHLGEAVNLLGFIEENTGNEEMNSVAAQTLAEISKAHSLAGLLQVALEWQKYSHGE